jgi:hypothetical protein
MSRLIKFIPSHAFRSLSHTHTRSIFHSRGSHSSLQVYFWQLLFHFLDCHRRGRALLAYLPLFISHDLPSNLTNWLHSGPPPRTKHNTHHLRLVKKRTRQKCSTDDYCGDGGLFKLCTLSLEEVHSLSIHEVFVYVCR